MSLLELAKKVESVESEKGFYYAVELAREINEAGVPVTMSMVEGSIDAVEKLRAELLPGYILLSCEQSFVDEDYYVIFQHKHSNHKKGYGKGKTEPLARLAALLRAVHAERVKEEIEADDETMRMVQEAVQHD